MRESIRVAWLLIGQKMRSIPRAFRSMDRGRRLLIVPFGFLAAGFVYLLYGVTRSVFAFLLTQGDVGEVIMLYGVTMIMSSLFFLLIVSTAVTAASTLFNSKETNWLFARPLSGLSIFIYKGFETSIYSLWIMFLLATPIFLALLSVYRASWFTYLLFISLILLLLGIACLIGLLLVFVLMRLVTISSRLPKLLIFFLFLLGGWYLFSSSQTSTSLLPDISSFAAIQRYLTGLRSSSPWLPSSWLSLSLFEWLKGEYWSAVYWLGMLASTLLFLLEVVMVVGYKYYRSVWLFVSSNTTLKRRQRKSHLLDYPLARRPLSLLEKDTKIFLRDPRQWFQTGLMLAMFIFFLLLLRQVPARFRVAEALYATMIAYLAFATMGYFFTTMALRFVYPAMSLEGNAFWFLLTSPISRTRLLIIKLLPMFSGLLAASSLGSAMISQLLNQPPQISMLSQLATVSAVSVIVMLTFSIGTIWMNLKERDPAKLSSNIPAIISTMIIFGYLTLIIMLLAVPFDSYFKSILEGGIYRKDLADLIIWSIVGSAGLASLVLWLVTRANFLKKDF